MLCWCELGCSFESFGRERARRIDLHRQNQLQVRESCPEKGLDKGPIETRVSQDLGGPSIGWCRLLQHVCLELRPRAGGTVSSTELPPKLSKTMLQDEHQDPPPDQRPSPPLQRGGGEEREQET